MQAPGPSSITTVSVAPPSRSGVSGEASSETDSLEAGEPGGRNGRRTAAILLSLVAIAGASFALVLVSQGNQGTVITTSRTPSTLPPGVSSRPATADFRPAAGEPPADILSALPVPAGSTATLLVNHDQGNGGYDRTVSYTTPVTYDTTVAFYRSALASSGWKVVSQVRTPGGEGWRILATKASSEGFFWETGVTVNSPVDPSAPSTHFTVRLYQVDDQ